MLTQSVILLNKNISNIRIFMFSTEAIMIKQIIQIILVIFVLNLFYEAGCDRVRLMERRKRLMQRRINIQNKLKPQICYEFVGCFADPPPQLSIKRPPEHPEIINTRFLLYTRNQSQAPETLIYGDNLSSIRKSSFNGKKNVKVIIHGYRGSGNDEGIILGITSFLAVEDTNVIVVDWKRGAGTSYGSAAANTELVGRQLSLIIMDAIRLGASPKNFHFIGFSLGAHVAGCASEMLKKNNLLMERITGLDPASPFFRNNLIRQRFKKLDISDARFVDIIHTDGSETLVDGFGLLKPMGHVDFFPNGGREQPGCTDVKNSVVVSHLSEESLDRSIACSHLRAWKLFIESIQSQLRKCKFVAWPCPQGAVDYLRGNCFPFKKSFSQEMGYKTNFANKGIFYLATRAEEPYCGDVVRASVTTSADLNTHTSGILYLDVEVENSFATFRVRCDVRQHSKGRSNFFNIAAINFETFSRNLTTPVIHGTMQYKILTENRNESSTAIPFHMTLKVDTVSIEDRSGNRWEYHEPGTTVGNEELVNIQLYATNEYSNRK